jgi:hypothetical protein
MKLEEKKYQFKKITKVKKITIKIIGIKSDRKTKTQRRMKSKKKYF